MIGEQAIFRFRCNQVVYLALGSMEQRDILNSNGVDIIIILQENIFGARYTGHE